MKKLDNIEKNIDKFGTDTHKHELSKEYTIVWNKEGENSILIKFIIK